MTSSSLASAIIATFSHRTKNTTTSSARTYRCRRTPRFGVMCAEQGACVRRRSWASYTIHMFEFEFPTGTGTMVTMARACLYLLSGGHRSRGQEVQDGCAEAACGVATVARRAANHDPTQGRGAAPLAPPPIRLPDERSDEKERPAPADLASRAGLDDDATNGSAISSQMWGDLRVPCLVPTEARSMI
jgi:hypothetical protein